MAGLGDRGGGRGIFEISELKEKYEICVCFCVIHNAEDGRAARDGQGQTEGEGRMRGRVHLLPRLQRIEPYLCVQLRFSILNTCANFYSN